MRPAAAVDETGQDGPIVLFDGVCNLCNAAVQFVIERDRAGSIRFAALQSDVGRELLDRFAVPMSATGPTTIYLIEDGRLFDRSTAALRIARHLRAPWPLASVWLVVPRRLRDALYDVVALRRYRWFGRSDACRLPSPEEAARFLG